MHYGLNRNVKNFGCLGFFVSLQAEMKKMVIDTKTWPSTFSYPKQNHTQNKHDINSYITKRYLELTLLFSLVESLENF